MAGDGPAAPPSSVPSLEPSPAFSPISDIAPEDQLRIIPPEPEDTTAQTQVKADPDPDRPPTPSKRSRTPDLLGQDGPEAKKLKTEPVEEDTAAVAEDILLAPEWDLEAMLSSALGALDPPPADPTPPPAVEELKPAPMETDLPPLPLPPPPMPKREPEKMKFIENPTYFVRAMGLPLLGSLAVQILLALFQQPSDVTDKLIRDNRTDGGKAYVALRATFMAAHKMFVETTPFLNADDLDVQDPGDRETIQMANLANMCASFYGPGGPTMATAHDNFLRIMIPENGYITKDISELYLNQKTQSFLAYANVMDDKDSTRAGLLEKFFSADLEGKLRQLHGEAGLPMSAEDFVRPHTERRLLLSTECSNPEKRRAVEARYPFSSFLDNLSSFIRNNFASILEYAETHGFDIPVVEDDEIAMLDGSVGVHRSARGQPSTFPGQSRPTANGHGAEAGYDSQGLASLLAEKLGSAFDGYSSVPYGQTAQAVAGGANGHLPPTQSVPTSILYERARQAAVAKSTSHARREGLHSTRRPWAPEEEKALMLGLDMVKGPHWSQILQLFGQHGSISDILKDRTQVQLKDKARNLKLFFLKTNSEMPYYLQCVTGELKTRAPSQAARKEAEERAKMNSEEDQARVQGIMTLAGGLQNRGQNGTGTAAAPNGVAMAKAALAAVGGAGGQQQQQQQQNIRAPNSVTTIMSGFPAIAPAPAPSAQNQAQPYQQALTPQHSQMPTAAQLQAQAIARAPIQMSAQVPASVAAQSQVKTAMPPQGQSQPQLQSQSQLQAQPQVQSQPQLQGQSQSQGPTPAKSPVSATPQPGAQPLGISPSIPPPPPQTQPAVSSQGNGGTPTPIIASAQTPVSTPTAAQSNVQPQRVPPLDQPQAQSQSSPKAQSQPTLQTPAKMQTQSFVQSQPSDQAQTLPQPQATAPKQSLTEVQPQAQQPQSEVPTQSKTQPAERSITPTTAINGSTISSSASGITIDIPAIKEPEAPQGALPPPAPAAMSVSTG